MQEGEFPLLYAFQIKTQKKRKKTKSTKSFLGIPAPVTINNDSEHKRVMKQK